MIYNAKQGRSRAIDRYAKTAQLPAGSDEALMLEALRRARFGLWRVERLHEITGLVISNLLSQTEAWLVDEGLWVRLADGSVFAARLCQPDRFSMTNGLIAMVTAESCEEVINNALIRQSPEPDPVADDSRSGNRCLPHRPRPTCCAQMNETTSKSGNYKMAKDTMQSDR